MTAYLQVLEEQHKWCFVITFTNGKKKYLTSSDYEIVCEGNTYLPYSGLNIISGNLNDSAHNWLELEGVFEERGITKDDDLLDAQIKILTYYIEDNLLKSFVTYTCTKVTKEVLRFFCYLQSPTTKLNTSLTECFSTTCRAKLGDLRCRVNLEPYSKVYKVNQISSNVIEIVDFNERGKRDGYYTEGTAVIGELNVVINKHENSLLYLSREINLDSLENKDIKLIAGCDKHFKTCYSKFNNAINFRGEPFIS